MIRKQVQAQAVKTNYTAMRAVAGGRESNKNILGERTLAGLGVIFGESGSGKSFVALDLAYAVARGIPWRGMEAVRGNVVYILDESSTGFTKRIKAYNLDNNIGHSLPLYILADSPNLLNVSDLSAVIRSIQALGDASLVIVDSLFMATMGGYEDMNLVTAHCKKIQEQTGATVLLIHYEALSGPWDFEIEVKRDGAKRSLTIARQKDGEIDQEFGFKLVEVVIGQDEDGEDVTSCVIEPVVDVPSKRGAHIKKGVNTMSTTATAKPVNKYALGQKRVGGNTIEIFSDLKLNCY